MKQRPKVSDFFQSPSEVFGWPLKACAGLLCVGLSVIALPLGVLGFGLMLYIWLILRMSVQKLPADLEDSNQSTTKDEKAPPSKNSADSSTVYAPVDGRVVHVGKDANGHCRIVLAIDVLDSHLHYAPVCGHVEDIIWIDGSFSCPQLDLSLPDERVRREIVFRTETNHQLILTQYGSLWCRIVQCFVHEGRKTKPTDCIGLSVFAGLVSVRFAGASDPSLKSGQRCLATQTVFGHTG